MAAQFHIMDNGEEPTLSELVKRSRKKYAERCDTSSISTTDIEALFRKVGISGRISFIVPMVCGFAMSDVMLQSVLFFCSRLVTTHIDTLMLTYALMEQGEVQIEQSKERPDKAQCVIMLDHCFNVSENCTTKLKNISMKQMGYEMRIDDKPTMVVFQEILINFKMYEKGCKCNGFPECKSPSLEDPILEGLAKLKSLGIRKVLNILDDTSEIKKSIKDLTNDKKKIDDKKVKEAFQIFE